MPINLAMVNRNTARSFTLQSIPRMRERRARRGTNAHDGSCYPGGSALAVQAGKPFRQFLLGETPKTGLPHQRTASPMPNAHD